MTVSGKGYKAPSRRDLSGRLLTNAVARAREVMEDQKIDWANYGCTILSDGWTDGKNRTIINFLVACKDNVVFLKSVDASNKVKNAETLAGMLERVIMEVGVENVVQIITDNAAAYVSAGRILQERHPTLFWTPCAAHVLDLLLEDIGKLEWVTPVVEDARRITKYIYNHPWVLNLMRQHTQGKDLVRVGVTRFATIFLTLQSILAALTSLKQMFVSGEWLNSPYSKKPEGEVVACIVFDNQFAQRAAEIVKVSEPLVRVLRLVDGDKTPMGYLYEAMDRAKESIKNYYKGDRLKFDPIWEIVDRRWNNQLHQPIHAAGYFLNPRFRFGGSYSDSNGEVMEGLSTCIERMVPDVEERDLIVSELQNYEGGRGKLFSLELARRGRTTQTPDAWWQNWGGNTPHLKKFALRVLCQPCSSSNCERNWSLFEAIHTKKRSKLAQKRLNDLVYVQYNLRLRVKKVEELEGGPIDLDDIDPYSDWTSQEQPPLFSDTDITDLERQAMEEGGGFGFRLDDIEEDEDEDEDEDSLPVPEAGGDIASSRMEDESQSTIPSEEAQSRPVPQQTYTTRQSRPSSSTSPHVFARAGKRKL
ncbi:uncharacterized protein LOC131876340 [Cryptomeria japonica]|uniref:uncharacterized protein LOC131876340 n=1 Tax=Cryptomeria japonica TaxID=3369 RepID=UPI0027DA687C|nr:uncharacterized protein LOC131876340 [Cryptomeria japonica]